jgi:hypothetical protein
MVYKPHCHLENRCVISVPGTAVWKNEGEEEADVKGSNPGWAHAMARVLNSKKRRKTRSIVLSKAKKLNEPAKTVKDEEAAVDVGDVKREVSSHQKHPRRKVSNSTTCR